MNGPDLCACCSWRDERPVFRDGACDGGPEGTVGGGAVVRSRPVIPFQAFTLVLGVYLFLTVLLITYFVSGMKEGDDAVDLRYQIGRTMPVALLIYSAASLVVGMMTG